MLPRDGLYVYAYRELLVCLKGYAKGGERATRSRKLQRVMVAATRRSKIGVWCAASCPPLLQGPSWSRAA